MAKFVQHMTLNMLAFAWEVNNVHTKIRPGDLCSPRPETKIE